MLLFDPLEQMINKRRASKPENFLSKKLTSMQAFCTTTFQCIAPYLTSRTFIYCTFIRTDGGAVQPPSGDPRGHCGCLADIRVRERRTERGTALHCTECKCIHSQLVDYTVIFFRSLLFFSTLLHFPLLLTCQAIATNLTVMAGLKVPIITIMIGEGGTLRHRTVQCVSVMLNVLMNIAIYKCPSQ